MTATFKLEVTQLDCVLVTVLINGSDKVIFTLLMIFI